ncbi:MAG: hypothetical protein AB7O66_22195 [Limisphaerales bacterium]
MKALVFLGLLTFLVLAASAQPFIRTTDLPSRVEDRRRAYVDASGAPVADLLGSTGGPQTWDFSHPRRSTETIHRIEIVAGGAGACSAAPPDAIYAERTTREDSGCASWEYYSLETGRGRLYHGLCDPCANPAGSGVVFEAPTLELPECTFGTSWERAVQWDDVLDPGLGAVEIAVVFTSKASVDAYGTLVLPLLGEVPALRVNETNTYTTFLKDFGIPLGSQYFHNLYWLVPGVGRAVHIVSKSSATAPPPLTDPPGRVLRVFEATPPVISVQPVENLAVQAEGSRLFLSWDSPTPGARFVIARGRGGSVIGTQVAAELAENPLSLPWVDRWEPILTNAQNFIFLNRSTNPIAEFFRVGWIPAANPP